jgi:vanillate O-demethylase ferredoxin subunit
MHEQICAGDILQISAPRNHFPLISAERYLLLAGGIGITPILCMAEHLSAANADFEMHYCARSPERAAFRSRIAESAFRDQVHFHYDSGAADQKLDFGELFSKQSAATHVFLCGPTGFIEHATNTARACGWPDDAVHFEYFSAAPVDVSGDTSFEVRLASSGNIYVIPPDQTVVAVLAQHGIEIPVSCEAGVCGTCLTRVLDGQPDHRDVFMTDEEHAQNDQFTPCCSRCKGDLLVLDL